jgi:hypothetical protein
MSYRQPVKGLMKNPLLFLCGMLIAASGLLSPPLSAQQAGTPQQPNTDFAPADPQTPQRLPATGFAMPDVPDEWNDSTSYDSRWFSTRFSFVALIDYNAFTQDADSERQVGDQKNEWDVRTVRLMARGRLKLAHPVDYLISVEVKGKDHVLGDASKVGFTDSISQQVSALSGRSISEKSRSHSSWKWLAMPRTCRSRSGR